MRLRRWLDTIADRRAARAARRARPATGLMWAPEPRLPGHFARGRRLAAGSLRLAGRTLESRAPFAAPPPSAAFERALHGWGWLDDLAACGEPEAQAAAREWLADWLARFGDGRGPGWRADLAGRRVLRWIEHALFLTAGAGEAAGAAYLAALARHAAFLARRWPAAAPGLPRIEALAGWLAVGAIATGLAAHAAPALAALAAEAEARIGPDGGIPERCPALLLEVTALLAWSRETAQRAGLTVPPALDAALLRAARALRALRHPDGSLARFHGGGAGPEGLADRIIALAAPQDRTRPVQAMGFARMDGGRSAVILDAALPPATPGASAAALGFELTSGRRPVVVTCGAGEEFGPDWAAAGRGPAGAATLVLDAAAPRPTAVTLHRSDERRATTLIASHDGWAASHGLTHSRELRLATDGRTLMGEDALTPIARPAVGAERRADAALRFHLHPAVEVRPDAGGARLALASGEVWLFRHDGPVRLDLEPSVWLEPGRRAPRPAMQIVLRGRVAAGGLRIGWTLAKAQDTPLAIRDTGRDEDLALPAEFTEQD